jgi:hypothetical protein
VSSPVNRILQPQVASEKPVPQRTKVSFGTGGLLQSALPLGASLCSGKRGSRALVRSCQHIHVRFMTGAGPLSTLLWIRFSSAYLFVVPGGFPNEATTRYAALQRRSALKAANRGAAQGAMLAAVPEIMDRLPSARLIALFLAPFISRPDPTSTLIRGMNMPARILAPLDSVKCRSKSNHQEHTMPGSKAHFGPA